MNTDSDDTPKKRKGRLGKFFEALSWPQMLGVCLLLLISPVAGVVQLFVVHGAGLCRGALGSGVTCEMGFLSGYFEGLLIWIELGFLMLYSIPWALLSFWILIYTIYCAIRVGLLLLHRN